MAARPVLLEPKAGGAGVADARLRQSIQELVDRVLPTWLRGSRLLDNGGAGYEITSGAILTIPHLLGRAHRGAAIVSKRVSAGSPDVAELRSDHASFNAALASTHVQFRSDAADAATIQVLVW